MNSEMAYSWQVVYPIQVRWNAEETLDTHSATVRSSMSITSPGIPVTSSPTLVTIPSASTTSETERPKEGNTLGLSKGALAGVVVSATCSVIGLVFGIGFKIYKHRKQVRMEKQRAEGGAF